MQHLHLGDRPLGQRATIACSVGRCYGAPMARTYLKVTTLVMAGLLAGVPIPARATGLCEGTPFHLFVAAIYARDRAVLFEGTAEVCSLDGDKETRQTFSIALVKGFGGGVRGRYVDATATDLTSSQRDALATTLGGRFELGEALARERVRLADQAATAPPAAADSAAAACQVVFDDGSPRSVPGDFPKSHVTARVVRGAETLLTQGLAYHAPHGGPVTSASAFLDKGLVLAVVTYACAGPPPGYFGPDDPGDCTPKAAGHVLELHGASTLRALAPCFAAQPAPH